MMNVTPAAILLFCALLAVVRGNPKIQLSSLTPVSSRHLLHGLHVHPSRCEHVCGRLLLRVHQHGLRHVSTGIGRMRRHCIWLGVTREWTYYDHCTTNRARAFPKLGVL
jgi:hypothetical protein